MRRLLLMATLLVGGPLRAAEMEPASAGVYAVGSTNLRVTVPAERPLMDYLIGDRKTQPVVYLDTILAEPEAVPVLQVSVPAAQPGAGALAGRPTPVVLTILYPTRADNPRPDYSFPYKETGDNVLPHMQGSGDAPILADPAAKYPAVIYSGGYNTHGIWHLAHLKTLASHGYIVVDIFHGDGRAPGYFESVALRQAAFRAALDYLLKDSAFGANVDAERIGASGSSAGGQTILAKLGGSNPSHPAHSDRDTRIKAGFGLVPFLGASFGSGASKTDAWAFGVDFAGLNQVKAPFFAAYADQDESVPPANVKAGVRQLGGPSWALELAGEGHLLSKPALREAYAWELLFFDAFLRGNAASSAKLNAATTVRDGRGHLSYSSPAH